MIYEALYYFNLYPRIDSMDIADPASAVWTTAYLHFFVGLFMVAVNFVTGPVTDYELLACQTTGFALILLAFSFWSVAGLAWQVDELDLHLVWYAQYAQTLLACGLLYVTIAFSLPNAYFPLVLLQFALTFYLRQTLFLTEQQLRVRDSFEVDDDEDDFVLPSASFRLADTSWRSEPSYKSYDYDRVRPYNAFGYGSGGGSRSATAAEVHRDRFTPPSQMRSSFASAAPAPAAPVYYASPFKTSSGVFRTPYTTPTRSRIYM